MKPTASLFSTAGLTALVVLAGAPTPALAYIGPGAGLGALASLAAVVVGFLIAVVGIVVFPLRLLMKRMKRKS